MMSELIKNDFFQYLSNVGSSKKWFTKIYTFFLCGFTYPLFIYMQYSYAPLISPLNDFLLFKRKNIIEQFKDTNEYTDAVFANDQFNYLNIGYGNSHAQNLDKSLKLNQDISKIIADNISLKNINNLIRFKKAGISISGYLYKLKPVLYNSYQITNKEKELIAKNQLEENNIKYIYNQTESGIIVKDQYNNHIMVSLPQLNIQIPAMPNTLTKYEPGVLIYNNGTINVYSNNLDLQNDLKAYMKNILPLLPENATQVIICNNIYLGAANTLGDELFNTSSLIINHQIIRSEALDINNNQLYEYINSQYNKNEINRMLINIIYKFNHNLLSLQEIEELFDVIPITFNMSINNAKLVDIEKNKLSMFSNYIYDFTLLLTKEIKPINNKGSTPIENEKEYKRWNTSIKTRHINNEFNKNYEVR